MFPPSSKCWCVCGGDALVYGRGQGGACAAHLLCWHLWHLRAPCVLMVPVYREEVRLCERVGGGGFLLATVPLDPLLGVAQTPS